MKKREKQKYQYDIIIFLLVFLAFIIGFFFFLDLYGFFLFLAMFLPISFILYVLYVLFPFGKVQYWQGDKQLLRKNLLEDWDELWLYQEKLDFLLKEFNDKTLEKGRILRDEQERRYWSQSWESFLEYLMALNTLTLRYQDFYVLNFHNDKDLHAMTFLISYLAFMYQYEAILRLLDKVEGNKDLRELFNASNYFKHWHLGSFDELRFSLTKWENLLRWRVGYLYFKFLRFKGAFVFPIFKSRGKGFIKSIKRLHKRISKRLRRKKRLFIFNPFRILRNYGLAFWFPIQKNVMRGASFVRLTERDYLITAEQIKTAEEKMQPSDLMIERRNWHLTNVGIPGFWPHSVIYLGKFDVFLEYFKELEEELGETIDHYLKSRFQEFYEVYKENEIAVIEVIRAGVIIQSLYKSAHADYWAVMRPRLTKMEKFIALTRALGELGKAYDFNYDFRSDDTLLCSELIYKSFLPNDEYKGLSFTLADMGRHILLPPNNIVKKFDEEYGNSDQELDFVLFFDGNENKQIAEEKGVEEFRKSWQRSKWDIMQE